MNESLALIHIGMMLAGEDELPDLVADQVFEIFGVNMYTEPDIITVCEKMKAIIEQGDLNGSKIH